MPIQEDPYKEFAGRYHWFFGEWQHRNPGYVQFFRKLFTENQVRRVLDCACGVGRDLDLFHSLGCETFGSDISDAMLAEARKNLARTGLLDVPLTQADFRELPRHFDTPFDAVVCLTSSLPHIHEEAELVRALKSMREVVREDGLLILSQGICDKLLKEKPRFLSEVNTRDHSRVFVFDYLGETIQIHVLDLTHTSDEKDFKVASFHYKVLLKDDYERLLTAAGLRDIRCYGSFEFEPYDREKSDRLILVARR